MEKIVIVLRDDLSAAQAANAAVVLGLALGGRLDDSVAPDSPDASGAMHTGLNPIPVPTLMASGDELHELHRRAMEAASTDSGQAGALQVVGFNDVARRARTYPEYVDALAITKPEDIEYVALIVGGPRGAVTKLTKRLALFA